MKEIPVSIYRGGTSLAIFFHSKDLPASIDEQDEIIIKAVGSGHSLQVNGLGGGNPLTSKCANVGPPSVPAADVDYTFVYPGVIQKASEVVIGHSSGQIALTAKLDEENGKWQALKIALNRTACEIMKRFVFIEN